MRKAVVADADIWSAQFGLAAVLHANRHMAEAISVYERALELDNENLHCLLNLAVCHLELSQFAAAEALARRAIAVSGDQASAWDSLGIVLDRQDRYLEAIEAFRNAQRLDAGKNGTHSVINLGIVYREVDRIQEAIDLFEQDLPNRPQLGAYGHYALALLTVGRFGEGWIFHESRWAVEPFLSLRPSYGKPVWAGQDPNGKTILICSEQGVGDLVQFIRYAPLLKKLGATVTLSVRPELARLVDGFQGIDNVCVAGSPLPAFDYYVHLLSLPRGFTTEPASIPAEIPYLYADAERVLHWKKRLRPDGMLKVGVVWAGDPKHKRDRFRSLPLSTLAPLWDVKGVRFFSLQKGAAAVEAATFPADCVIENPGPDLDDYADTVALITQLDIVVCVDTSVAHLAGALGKPIWILLPKPADWRWLEDRDDSPWYPTARLFRQSRAGHWDDVVQRVKTALQTHPRRGASDADAGGAVEVASGVGTRQPTGNMSVASGVRPGFAVVAETRIGILQYLPEQSIVGQSIELYGEFLQPQLNLLGRIIRPGATIIQVGAGVGVHAVFLATAIGPSGHLILYEAHSAKRQILRNNLEVNRLANFTIMKRTLGGPTAAASSVGNIDATAGESTPIASTAVITETVDELDVERLDWLKIDDEAAALDVLDGGRETLWRLRPLLFIAAPDEPKLMQLVDHVKQFSYRCWRMESGLFNPMNFNCRLDNVFGERRALALLAIPAEVVVDVVLDGCIELP